MIKSYQIQKCKLVKEKNVKYECETVNTPDVAVKVIRKHIADETEEHVIALALNVAGEIIALHEISHGGIASAVVNPGDVLKRVLLNNATSFIIAHNHPSGNCKPSNADNDLTMRMKSAADIVGVPMVDHIIVTEKTSYSYKRDSDIL